MIFDSLLEEETVIPSRESGFDEELNSILNLTKSDVEIN
jgi:hypothetical protein